ncbi:ammonium transporter [Ornithinimicrobium cryptoxanthini]|uniref:Ammonium transporter n=1 Tax=Ornithinimicrobium cryptoxanthini TaxID=2934161 RepID=A0ABY4YJS9_9MICO|nr:ammonium transporter [Ornithinimicrobium cryptoxanthini]USQ76770.1 ammonium transporter [Ornithinimicrobium cryptoxanthini]
MELTATDVWVMVSAALVLLMTPGLAFFYGGLARAKAALNMVMMSFVSIGLVGVVWVLWGYGMTSSPGILGGLVGDPTADLGLSEHVGTADLIGIGYAATFAIITVALISGAVADRTRFSAWCVFVPVWVTLVYCPLAFMVWGGGLLSADGAIGRVFGEAVDFAGGTVVHINAGVAALVLVLVLGRRTGWGKGFHRPHNVPVVMIGAALLWFGWFGFNGGAAGSVEEAGLIWVNTLAAPAAAMLGWLLVESIRDGRPTSVGAASGVVAGLVAITPACAALSPVGSLVLGAVAGVGAALAIGLKFRVGFDDALDVVGVHLVAGLIGTVGIGFLMLPVDGAGGGLFYGGGVDQLVAQVVAAVFTMVFTGVLTAVIALAIARTVGFRVSPEDEERGVDLSEHAEFAYEFGTLGSVAPDHEAVVSQEVSA